MGDGVEVEGEVGDDAPQHGDLRIGIVERAMAVGVSFDGASDLGQIVEGVGETRGLDGDGADGLYRFLLLWNAGRWAPPFRGRTARRLILI